jgi:hypothetical protein
MAATARRVITHIHSRSSNGEASASHDLVSKFCRHEFGAAASRVVWAECDTTIEMIEALLAGRLTSKPVDLVVLTDHMSPQRHAIEPATLELARRCHRFAIGSEIRTCLPDGTGGFMAAPEVLLYGVPERHRSEAGSHYGLTQPLVDGIFDTCIRPGATVPDLYLLREYCVRERIVHALAHPLDGHALALTRLIDAIRSFGVIETLNGGYPQLHARLLGRLLRTLEEEGSPENGQPGRRVSFVELGGSDAHIDDFDRVVTLLACDDEEVDAGTFIAALARAVDDPAAASRITPSGHGISGAALRWEILRLIVKNLAWNRHLLASWWRLPGMLARGISIASGELRGKNRTSGKVSAELAAWLDGIHEPSLVRTGRLDLDTNRTG